MADKKRDILEFVEQSNFEQMIPTHWFTIKCLKILNFYFFLQVLEYWSQLLSSLLTEKEFDTFDIFLRKMIEFDLIIALNISFSDFEERHLHKTFIVLNKLKNFAKRKFPDLKLSGKQTGFRKVKLSV